MQKITNLICLSLTCNLYHHCVRTRESRQELRKFMRNIKKSNPERGSAFFFLFYIFIFIFIFHFCFAYMFLLFSFVHTSKIDSFWWGKCSRGTCRTSETVQQNASISEVWVQMCCLNFFYLKGLFYSAVCLHICWVFNLFVFLKK